jgi:hypothetical protein
MLETYVRPFPLSTLPSKEATLAGVETAPPHIIADIQVNDEARDLLPKNLQYLASAEYFRSNLRMSVPNNGADTHVLVPTTSGRVIPIGCGVVPFGSADIGWHLGRIITGKGSWATGSRERAQVDLGEPYFDTHIGLLSVEGAKGDVAVSNTLLSHGFRSALHLGYIIFDDARLKSWLASRWAKTNHRAVLKDAFEKVKESGGSAYLFRLGGSLERIDNRNYPHYQSLRMRAETMQSSRLLAAESRLPNSALSPVLSLINNADKAITALTKIGNGSVLNHQEYVSYADFLCALVAQNASALNRIVASNAAVLAGAELSKGKDTDLAWYGYDFDMAISNGAELTMTDQDNINCYIDTSGDSLSTHLSYIVAPHFLYPGGYGSGAISRIVSDIPDRISEYVASQGLAF